MIRPRRRFIVALLLCLSTCGRPGWVKCKELHDVNTMYLIAQAELHQMVAEYKQQRRKVHLRVTQRDIDRVMRDARDAATHTECWVPDWRG